MLIRESMQSIHIQSWFKAFSSRQNLQLGRMVAIVDSGLYKRKNRDRLALEPNLRANLEWFSYDPKGKTYCLLNRFMNHIVLDLF